MINKRLCRRVFENYLADCGLDAAYWDCDEAGEMIFCYLAAHDFVMSRRFADWPMSVRSQIVCSTVANCVTPVVVVGARCEQD